MKGAAEGAGEGRRGEESNHCDTVEVWPALC